MAQSKQDQLVWAEDVLWVYENIDNILRADDPEFTKARNALHEWASEENSKNRGEFLKTMVPKAVELREKWSRADEDLEMEKFERKSIIELQKILADSMAELDSVEV